MRSGKDLLLQRRRAQRTDKHLVEWILFLVIATITFDAGWTYNSERLPDFFSHAWDGLGYYQWLPATFVTQNFDWMFWCHKIAEGKAISLFTLGVSVLELPFFLVSQWLTWLLGYEDTGFSPPNAVAMMACAATYCGAGAVFSFKLARRFSSTPAALLAVVAIMGCSNLLFYATKEPLMSHVYSYFLITLFCWCSVRIIDGPRPWEVFAFLFSGALMVLVRHLSIVVAFFPLMLAWSSPGGIPEAWRRLLKHRGAFIAGVVVALVPWILQSIYWVQLTGHVFVNGYAYKNEHFDFARMVPGMVLFSPINGWFIYSPVFLIVMATLLVHAWRNTRTARATLLIVILMVLIYSAWWCWWLGGAFGYRGLIDLYGILAIPFAWFFRSVLRRAWSMRIFTGIVVVMLIRLNMGMMERNDFAWCLPEWTYTQLWEVMGRILAGR